MASISWVADSPLWRMFSRFVFALVGPESSLLSKDTFITERAVLEHNASHKKAITCKLKYFVSGCDIRDTCWYTPRALEQCKDFIRSSLTGNSQCYDENKRKSIAGLYSYHVYHRVEAIVQWIVYWGLDAGSQVRFPVQVKTYLSQHPHQFWVPTLKVAVPLSYLFCGAHQC